MTGIDDVISFCACALLTGCSQITFINHLYYLHVIITVIILFYLLGPSDSELRQQNSIELYEEKKRRAKELKKVCWSTEAPERLQEFKDRRDHLMYVLQ